jgi:anti-anti-sigma regulatory factor
MEIKHEKGRLFIEINGNLDYLKVKELEKRITEEDKNIEIRFVCSNFIDTEGIKFLYTLYRNGVKIILKNPPELFFQTVKILSLEELTDLVKE